MSKFRGVAGGFAGFLATSIGGQRPFGVEGWRVVFFIVAAVSALVGCIVALLAADPRRKVRRGLGLQGRRHCMPSGMQGKPLVMPCVWVVQSPCLHLQTTSACCHSVLLACGGSGSASPQPGCFVKMPLGRLRVQRGLEAKHDQIAANST